MDEDIRKTFRHEINSLCEFVRNHTWESKYILPKLSALKDVSKILSQTEVFKLCASLDSIYKSIDDKKIERTENLSSLIELVAQELCRVEKESISDEDLKLYIMYCDKAAAGEIFDVTHIKISRRETKAKKTATPILIPEKPVEISLREVNEVLTVYEEILSRTYRISNVVEQHKNLPDINQIENDVQFLRNSILHTHDKFLSLVENEEYFLNNHSDCHGFFVFANGKKYFISSEHIEDVTYENELEYIIDNGQMYLTRKEIDENGEEVDINIPIYLLSSLFPEQKTIVRSAVDTILIAHYLNQRIGIMVENIQKFATLVKKTLPPSFANFHILEGVVFDEKFDIIPILHIPEIMKRFRSQRLYDLKKFEARTKRKVYKILVVDDSETTRQILTTILSENGFYADSVSDGIEAIEMLKSKQFDLIVTDDEMPRMNGEILVDNLRRMENYEKVPVVAIAANPVEKADAFVCKAEFQRKDVLNKIRDLLYE